MYFCVILKMNISIYILKLRNYKYYKVRVRVSVETYNETMK